MLGWVSYKTKEQREKDKKEFNEKVFPFGDVQKEKIEGLLKQLIPSFDPEITVYQYLVCKDMLRKEKDLSDEEKIFMTNKALRFTMKKKNKADLYRLIALCEADLGIDEQLNYPETEMIENRARQLQEI